MDPTTQKRNNSMDIRFANFYKERYCFNVVKLPYDVRCEYVRNSPDCSSDIFFVNYVEVVLCTFEIKSRFEEMIALCMLSLLMCVYTYIIARIADVYFTPALKVIANKLYMSEHLAGVSIVAFGCTISNLLANISSIRSGDPVLSNTLASGLCVILVSGGLTCYISPFQINPNSTIVLILFFIMSCLYLDYAISGDGSIQTHECVILILIYVGFLAVTVADLVLLNRQVDTYRKELEELRQRFIRDYKREEEIQKAIIELVEDEGTELKSKDTSNEGGRFTFTTEKLENVKREVVDAKATRIALHHLSNPRNRHIISDFLENITPIDLNDWSNASWLRKVFMIYRIPIIFFCIMVIPRVDVEESKHAWTKLLNMMHCIITPSLLLTLILASLRKKEIFWYLEFDWKTAIYPLPISVPICIIVYFTSRTDLPPTYHFMFVILSIITSIVIISICSIEINEVSQLVSTVLSFSEGFMGVTINALSLSVGDLIVNVTMAWHGYEQIAFASSIGSPFLDLIFSLGIVYLLKAANLRRGYKVNKGFYGTTVYVFLMLALTTMVLWTTILNFQSRRSVGIFQLILYSLFIIMVILIETETIHSWEHDEIIPLPEGYDI